MTYAVLRVRSPRDKQRKAEDTLKMLRLERVNHCTIIPDDKEHKGMLNRVKDIVTWGEVDKDTLVKLLTHRSTLDGGLNDDIVSENTDYDSIEEFAEAYLNGKVDLDDIEGLKNLFRMHPPKGGYKSVKKPFNTGGSLGYRGENINDLLQRMLGPKNNDN